MKSQHAKNFVVWLVLLAGMANVVYPATPSHCTAMAGDHCFCAGCSSFRTQQRSLVAPPPVPPAATRPSGRSTLEPDRGEAPEPQFDLEPPSNYAEQVPFSDASAVELPSDAIASSLSGTSDSAGTNVGAGNASPSASQFAAAFGDSAGAAGIPAMLGDFCGLSASPVGVDYYRFDDIDGQEFNTHPNEPRQRRAVTTPVAGGDCRHKWAEFTSPLPTDRVFFTYHHYNNGLRDYFFERGDADLFTIGIEKTFWNGLVSVEKRIGFLGGGLNSTQSFGDTFGAELGNMATSFKVLLWQNRQSAFSGGMTTVWPTGDDGLIPGVMKIRNESVHLMPFFAMLARPNARWFHQANVQFDFDANGDTVIAANGDRDVIQDQTFLYLDYSIGRWFYRNPCGFVRQVAALTELHYSASLNGADLGNQGLFADVNFNVLNLTAGLHFQLSNATTFRVVSGAPLRTGGDRAFDSEIALQLARYF